ncbi:MAG: S-adenosylmethionine:tRNA ribosyltransferase-isomerase [Prevotella sp.]|uniref:S-adenosylmethionine:tRNA ribosyltransferase-isomerase n=1 Tax=Prevotella sp. TaxID=59823 RepID=UPI002A346204|nr:S-adenosylmethionine:tRNA ribosyltransferase-isomerase [Prevotella sp.]MDD7318669.1 S-adenosylmethionine:tRNA ribosyltransferase-isomerase [Prevotellaceae bacterium]MDY4019375.1 S-adenosylmethionine:tRNA ribosyltransferase-isomerase [Prevotella sp.]
MTTKEIKIGEFNYELPDEKIAKFPLPQRDHSKLLVYENGKPDEDIFYNLQDHLPSGSLMIFNNTRVIQARLHFRKTTGALIEVFLLEPYLPADYERIFQQRKTCSWLCMIGNLKKWKGETLVREINIGRRKVTLRAEKKEKPESSQYENVCFSWDSEDLSFSEILDAVGELPIPPYLNRDTEESDKTTYQTVYGRIDGSVAAPTAGLHFSDAVLKTLDSKGIERQEVTLHVGAGTFKPVKAEEIGGHDMHTEYICVERRVLESIIAHGADVVAVGTTSVRTIESLYFIGSKIANNPEIPEEQLHVDQWEPYETDHTLSPKEALQNIIDYLDRNGLHSLHTSTQIIIAPGYEYKYVKRLITNFHQPQSTLLLLVSAFLKGHWREVYDYALSHDFRFLSYGDSSLLVPPTDNV